LLLLNSVIIFKYDVIICITYYPYVEERTLVIAPKERRKKYVNMIHLYNEKCCYICGKKLHLFSGYYHPTLGKDCMICGDCYNREQKSIERWGRFVLWNSFNPESPDPTYIDSYPFPKNIVEHPDEKEKQNKYRTKQ